ncbi:MAG: insulinase family protein [Candidatus Obscuribacterales bacterium]|nr:insulinase family protein [Candidatus Obscuribacterales bacterium]
MKLSNLIPLLACVGLISSTACVLAEESKTTQAPDAEAWRNKPPALPAPRPFTMPVVDKYKLANGLTVELVEDHRVPWTTVSLGFRSGVANDRADQPGVASMVADMVTEGTKSRTSKQVAEQIDYIGGGISTTGGADNTYVSASGLSEYNGRLLNLLADVCLNPSFPEDELKLKKTNKIQELTIQRGRSEFLVDERFAEVVFGQHPYGIISPKPAQVEKITRDQLVAYHANHYVPNDAILVVVGDFKKTDMKALIEKEFGAWKSGKCDATQVASFPKHTGKMIHLVDRPDSAQSSLKIGNLGLKRDDPDFYTSMVANQVLGGGAISRLFLNLREKHGFTYGAYSMAAWRRQPGFFSADANVRTEVTAPALKEFLTELDKIRKDQVSADELKHAKTYMVGVFQLGLESQGGLGQRLLEAELFNLPEDYLEKYGDRVMAVTPEDIQRVASKMIDVDNLQMCVVGDSSKIKAELEKIGPVTVYDTNGCALSTVKTPATKPVADGG